MRITHAFICLCAPLLAQDPTGREQGRSMTIATNGIVATSQILASQAGAEILIKGGSAVDAAIAANAVLALVEPMNAGIGGDLFAMVWTPKDGKLQGLNASGWSPKDLTIEFLKQKGIIERIPGTSIHTVTIPGAAAGWAALHKRYPGRP
jgi:gamma-glutamyltranspeptidase/glutathione hydrolase